ncbi:hypothetical protein [Embleya sp. NPDC020630]|uniref:hypothetical protein n=1 Tax=Embleya sp. NPDC020630 TaxID=3363979 RepID=UPI0037A9102B
MIPLLLLPLMACATVGPVGTSGAKEAAAAPIPALGAPAAMAAAPAGHPDPGSPHGALGADCRPGDRHCAAVLTGSPVVPPRSSPTPAELDTTAAHATLRAVTSSTVPRDPPDTRESCVSRT